MPIEVEATRVFYRNQASQAPIVINRGGARSTKSYSVSQLLTSRLLQSKKRKILVLRKTLPSLKDSTYKDYKEIWESWGATSHIREEKMNLDYHYDNNLLHFGSLDNPEKIKSSKWNDIMMEEMTEFNYEDLQQLRLRQSCKVEKGDPANQLFGCLNPTDEYHWIKEKVIDKMAGVEDIHSTFRDNPYLDESYVKLLEELKVTDPAKWKIYGEGEWGRLDNLIYSNWEAVDKISKNIDETFYGLDFGYNAPSALIKISMYDQVPYEEELLYETGLTTKDLIDKLNDLIKDPNDPIYCDNAEPDRIEEIRRAGFNAIPADKSVNDGIDFVKSLQCKILKSSSNLIKEVRGYSWKQDKDGRVIDTPVKFNDHLMDARRYAYYSHIGKRSDFRIRWL